MCLLEEKHNSGIYLHICFQVKNIVTKSTCMYIVSSPAQVVQQCTVLPFPHQGEPVQNDIFVDFITQKGCSMVCICT